MKKKFTRKVQRSRGIVNKKKNNRKRVTKKVKLSKKNLNKKNKRRPRIVKKGGSEDTPGPESIVGGNSHEGPQMGGSSCGAHGQQMGGEDNEEDTSVLSGGSSCGSNNRSKGGAHNFTPHTVGGSNKVQKGGNSCGCGV